MERQDNIKDLFRDRFESFETDVDQGLWENISKKMESGGDAEAPKEQQGIESAVREKFKSFEPKVNPGVWSAVQSQLINQVASVGAAGSSGLFSSGAAWLAGAVAVLTTVGGIAYYNTQSSEEIADHKQSEITVENEFDAPQIVEVDKAQKTIQKENTTEKKSQTSSQTERPTINNNTKEVNHRIAEAVAQTGTELSDETGVGATNDSNVGKVEHANNTEAVTHNEIPTKEVNVDKAPEYVKMLEASTLSGNAPLTVDFGTLESCYKVVWSFENGESKSLENHLTHTFEKPGKHLVSLIYQKDEESKPLSECIIIEVKNAEEKSTERKAELSNLEVVQNVLTPNNDDINETFKVVHENLRTFNMRILHISGREVFKTSNPDIGWNGKEMNGELVPEGTYFYIITGEGIDKTPYNFKGSITLYR